MQNFYAQQDRDDLLRQEQMRNAELRRNLQREAERQTYEVRRLADAAEELAKQ